MAWTAEKPEKAGLYWVRTKPGIGQLGMDTPLPQLVGVDPDRECWWRDRRYVGAVDHKLSLRAADTWL